MIYIVISLIAISAIAKTIMDTLQFHFDTSVFKGLGNWWDPANSWRNKYTWFPNSKVLTWLISNPLVAITDAWHLFGLIRDASIFACIPLLSGNYWLFIGYIPYRVLFHVLYTYILNKKQTT